MAKKGTREQSSAFTSFREKFLSYQIDLIEPETTALLGAGVPPRNFLRECQRCMEEIGRKFEEGEYYLPELVVSGEMFKTVSEKIRPLLSADADQDKGKIVLGTPQGDIHNLGKDIFGVLAESSGITVYDLGVDVPPRAFVEKIEETGAAVLGMSALVTAAFAPMEEVVSMLEKSGLRKGVSVVIGGGVTNRNMIKRFRVDAQTLDAYEGLKIVKSILEKKEKSHAAA